MMDGRGRIIDPHNIATLRVLPQYPIPQLLNIKTSSQRQSEININKDFYFSGNCKASVGNHPIASKATMV